MHIPRYYSCEKDFEHIHHALKLYPCPYCRLPGFLILHGFLFGYFDICPHALLRRGHRVFCSNRNNRNGCGKTFCLLLAQTLKGFTISAHSVWLFIKGAVSGQKKQKAFKAAAGRSFSAASAYRLWKRFLFSQPRLRTLLLSRSPPPSGTQDIPTQTIAHLIMVFSRAPNPIPAFQLCFQTSFFSH